MTKLPVIAAALLAGSFYGLATPSTASAQDWRAQSSCGWNSSGRDCARGSYDYGAGVGVNSYCAPGQIPEPFPNGNGIRCQAQDGTWR